MSEELSDFYEQLNEAQSEKQVVINVTIYIVMITTFPCLVILSIIMLAPTLMIALVGSLVAVIVWVLSYHFYSRMIHNAVAAKTFLYVDTIIGDALYEEQLCVVRSITVVEPEKDFDIDDLRRDMTEIESSLSVVQAMKIGDIRERDEDDID